ncbi:OmpA family protein [Candidatus Magnetominusculus xianensis]|nr:OmpA family protein [Candidatus Magnetominusculus xianensis]MBF0402799.1 OmpA family protein [Nitrospirota bacterium]
MDSLNKANSITVATVNRIMLARASAVASSGYHKEAERLIHDMPEKPHEALDLLARIYAQQGKFTEAKQLWTKALTKNANNESYQAGLRRIAKMESRSLIGMTIAPMMIGVLIIICMCILGYFFVDHTNHLRALLIKEIDERFLSNRDYINQQLVLSQNTKPEKTPPPKDEPHEDTKPDIKIEIPGISTKYDSDKVIVIFDTGLFSQNITLKYGAREQLALLGHELKPHAGRISISVTGYTDDLVIKANSGYADNIALGMLRAVAVVEYLRKVTGFPSEVFSVRSLGELHVPFPNDSKTNRHKNRTVSIIITNIKK